LIGFMIDEFVNSVFVYKNHCLNRLLLLQ